MAKLAKASSFISELMHVAHKQLSQSIRLGQTTSKGMLCLSYSNEQTTPVSASNLQCSNLIVLKQYRAGACFHLADGLATILFLLAHGFAIVFPIKKTFESPSVSEFLSFLQLPMGWSY